jgi:RND family efflux transporter MFP subunit
LVVLDSTVIELNIRSLKAGIAAAEAQLEEIRRLAAETERLVNSQNVPETRRQAAQAQVSVQEANTQQLQAELLKQEELLARHQIRAPFAGQINERLVDQGDSVNLNQPVVSLVNLDSLRARIYVSDVEVDSFTPGQEVKLFIDARPQEVLSVNVSTVARSADPVSGLFLVEMRIPNNDQALSGGSRGRIVAEIARFTDALFIPASAVRFDGDRVLAEVWKGEEAVSRELRIGPEVDGEYPVFAGLDEGEVVILR